MRPSFDISSLLQTAMAQHRAGRLDEARRTYERILRTDRKNPTALTWLGLIVATQGNVENGMRLIRRALAFFPESIEALSNLGYLLALSQRPDEALANYDKAVELGSKDPELLNNRGTVLLSLDRQAEALVSYDRAIALRPEHPEAHNNRGNALLKLNRHQEALASFDTAIALRPGLAEAWSNRGLALQGLNRNEEALASHDKADSLRPQDAVALNNRGMVLHGLGRFEEALASHDQAIALRPQYSEAHNNRGRALHSLNRVEEALASYDTAIALSPHYAVAINNRGSVLAQLGRHVEAIDDYRKAVAVNPELAPANWNESHSRLALGEMDIGWRLYEDRWRFPEMAAERIAKSARPTWTGDQALSGKTVLLSAEQGLGDTLQFVRYVPLVAARGARVLLEVQTPLVRLVGGMAGANLTFARGEPVPAHDYFCSLMSLPHAFGTRIETIPGEVPYLRADPTLVAAWQKRLAGLTGLRIGLVWAGAPRPFLPWANAIDRRRSITLTHFRRLSELPGISLVSLQKGEAASQTAMPPSGLLIHDWTEELGDFSDTAALVEALDLVISVDTSVVHLTGALGKPVWLLNRFDACWRWLVGREDSPWYPTLRQFRQPAPGNWDSVMADLNVALAQVIAAGVTAWRNKADA